MGKDTFYFQHDYNARNDDKILELRSVYGVEGYGVFWMIIETMAENSHGGLKASLLGGVSIGFGITRERLVEIIDFCVQIELLFKEQNCYYSKRLLRHKDFRKFLSDKGKEGVRLREERKHGFMGGLNGASSKERKGKEIKGVKFNEEKNAVILNDGSSQKLGETQYWRVNTLKDLPAHEIYKGQIS